MSDYVDTQTAETSFRPERESQPTQEEIINYLNQVKAYSDDNQVDVPADDSNTQQEVSTQELLMALANVLQEIQPKTQPKELSDDEIQALSKEQFLDMLLEHQQNSQKDFDEKRAYL